MTDEEISRRLALAIGWPENMVWNGYATAWIVGKRYEAGQEFDYRDPAVIWPIAERFDCFPVRNMVDGWRAWGTSVTADTAAKAVALAVIKAHEVQK
jgi:hypothetical protein